MVQQNLCHGPALVSDRLVKVTYDGTYGWIHLLKVDKCYEECDHNAGEDDTEDREDGDEEPDGQERNTKHYCRFIRVRIQSVHYGGYREGEYPGE